MVEFPKKYTMTIDKDVQTMAIKDVNTYGIDDFVDKACIRLDCSRKLDDMRLMQTIGTPYPYEVSRTLCGINYALEQGLIDNNQHDEYVSKLVALHKRNLKYEEENPPIVYDKSKKVKNTRTSRKKPVEDKSKDKSPTAAQLNAQARANLIAKLKIRI